MAEIRTGFLFTLKVEVESPQWIGRTQYGERRIVPVRSGSFAGPELNGRVLPGGSDWILVRPDGVTELDVRLALEAADGALIYMRYRGLRHGPAEVMERVNRGEPVDPASYYFRIIPRFETASDRYGWLNRVFAIGTGERTPTGPVYSVHQVL